MNVNVTIEYGINNHITKSVPVGTSYGAVLGDPAIKAVLGYGDNVQPVVDGVPQPTSNVVADGDVIVVQVKANTKA